jgi:hypothetical protein
MNWETWRICLGRKKKVVVNTVMNGALLSEVLDNVSFDKNGKKLSSSETRILKRYQIFPVECAVLARTKAKGKQLEMLIPS